MTTSQPRVTRRAFLQKSTLATAALASFDFTALAGGAAQNGSRLTGSTQPWFRRTLRWGQTNITEIDPQRYDLTWWRQHWNRTRVQGVIINAGGIVAYYPSKFPLHYRAATLGDRDLYGELARAAREEGLAVLARMDSNRVHEDFHRAHPDWFALNSAGQPYRDTGLFVTCINSPYYEEYLPSVLREIIERSQPDGITDNSWAGLGRDSICYCEHCRRKFQGLSGRPIPRAKDWNDSVYRQWIQWNYARRLEVWDLFNRVTRDAGGPHCLWLGMQGGTVSDAAGRFRDLKAICERSEIVMLDDQARNNAGGFQHNGEAGKLIHGLLDWEKLIPESMAMYQAGQPTFRLASKPAAEARLWMLDGFAGGVQPWWHHVGAEQEDRRMFRTAEPVMRWHEKNQQYLVNRQPIATAGLVWSQENADFFGRDDADALVGLPWRGWTNALVRARIPYLPVHADHIARDAGRFSVLILPNLGAMSAAQIEAVRNFVNRGGGLIATGQASRCNESGELQPDFALADLLGAHITGDATSVAGLRRAAETQQTYLRLTPELRAQVYGPKIANAPAARGQRHPVLKGFDETDLIAFGGTLQPLRVDGGATVLATWVPAFPSFPPEEAWMRQPRTEIPGLIVNENGTRGRVAFLPADLDARYSRDNLPDHGNLLANLVHWAARENVPLQIEGAGLVDCHLYRQEDHLVLHLVNLTNAGTWRAPVDELIPLGTLSVRVQLPAAVRGRQVRLLVSETRAKAVLKNGWLHFNLPGILDHEVAVIG